MRKIVSAKMLGTDKRIIGYLLDEPTGQFVSTYTVPGPSGKQLILKAEKVNSESIIFLMNEPEIDESIEERT